MDPRHGLAHWILQRHPVRGVMGETMSNIGSVTKKTAPAKEESQAAAVEKTLPVDRHLAFGEDSGVSVDPALSHLFEEEGADLRWGKRYVNSEPFLSVSESPTLKEYHALYDKRTRLTKTEQAIESIIYDKTMIWNASTISAFLVAYEIAKNERAAASLAVAAAYMRLTPEDRFLADKIYDASDDKKRRTSDSEVSL